MKKFVPAAVLTLFCTVALVAMAMRAPMTAGGTVAILFPPQTTLIAAVTAVGEAGGRVERTGRWDNIIVASFPGAEPPVAVLKASGAWLVFNALVAGGCDPATLQAQLNASPNSRGKSDRGFDT
ncbi:hypothetical protein EOI86_14925 [Hwanghaeella grinnelliae]|uniref:Uncharacterized protein n=1 Tax=Hwanghaeella grinnelliae TaxID=2500179 RepID=A0A3S2VPN0_9PROT|nr:hypothetical protein [Hwanghaeella grinnelliae]RVU36484.1 hypothetical protein EOI86_14925 [Hwanghaeella grinnelliae]